MYSYIGKSVLNGHLGSSTDPCYIQNRVITNRVIKRLSVLFTISDIKESYAGLESGFMERLLNCTKWSLFD